MPIITNDDYYEAECMSKRAECRQIKIEKGRMYELNEIR